MSWRRPVTPQLTRTSPAPHSHLTLIASNTSLICSSIHKLLISLHYSQSHLNPSITRPCFTHTFLQPSLTPCLSAVCPSVPLLLGMQRCIPERHSSCPSKSHRVAVSHYQRNRPQTGLILLSHCISPAVPLSMRAVMGSNCRSLRRRVTPHHSESPRITPSHSTSLRVSPENILFNVHLRRFRCVWDVSHTSYTLGKPLQ